MGAEKPTAKVVKKPNQTDNPDSIKSLFEKVNKSFDVDDINEYIKTATETLYKSKSRADAILIMKHITLIKDELKSEKVFIPKNHIKDKFKESTMNKLEKQSFYKRIDNLFYTSLNIISKSFKKSPYKFIQAVRMYEKHNQEPKTTDELNQKLKELIRVIKPQNLPGKLFFRLCEELVHEDAKSPLAKEVIFKLLATSKNIPFKNIVVFKDAIKTLANSYSSHKSDFLIKITLKRGKDILREDNQTSEEIDKILGKCEYGKLQKEIEKSIKNAESLIDDEKYSEALKILKTVGEIEFREQGKVSELTGWSKYVTGIITPVLNDAMLLKKKAIEWIIYEGEELYEKKKYNLALKKFDEVLSFLPMHSDAITLSAKCFYQINYKKAETAKTLEGPPKPGEKIHKIPGYNDEAFGKEVKKITTLMEEEKPGKAIGILKRIKKYENPIVDYLLIRCYTMIAMKTIDKGSAEMNKIKSAESKIEKYKIIGRTIPHFTKGLKIAKEANRYQSKLIDKNLDYSWAQGSVFYSAINPVNNVHNKLYTTLGARTILVEPHQSESKGKTVVVPIFQDYINQSANLETDKRKELADYYKARADILGDIYPKRKSTIWDLYRANFNQDKKIMIELKDKAHARKHTAERESLGLETINLSKILSDFAKLNTNKEIQESVSTIGKALTTYGKLQKKLKRKKDMTKEEIKDEKRKDERVGKKFESIKWLETPIKKIEEGLDTAIESLHFQINKFLLSGEGTEKTRETAVNIQSLTQNTKTLLMLAEKSAKKIEYENELPEKKEGEKSIDYEAELAINMVALESYLEAVENDPDNINNYKDLAVFLVKIGFITTAEFNEEIMRTWLKEDAEAVSESLIHSIQRKIEFRTGPLLAELGIDVRKNTDILPYSRNRKTREELEITDFSAEYTDGSGGELDKDIILFPTINPSFPRKPRVPKKQRRVKWARMFDFEPIMSVNPETGNMEVMPGLTLFPSNIIKAIQYRRKKKK